jgi:hypothetical protein
MSLYRSGVNSPVQSQAYVGANVSDWGLKEFLAIAAGFFTGVLFGRLF